MTPDVWKINHYGFELYDKILAYDAPESTSISSLNGIGYKTLEYRNYVLAAAPVISNGFPQWVGMVYKMYTANDPEGIEITKIGNAEYKYPEHALQWGMDWVEGRNE